MVAEVVKFLWKPCNSCSFLAFSGSPVVAAVVLFFCGNPVVAAVLLVFMEHSGSCNCQSFCVYSVV